MQNNNTPSLHELFADDPDRAASFCLQYPRFFLDYSRIPFESSDRDRLFALAEQCELRSGIRALFAGDAINASENRPALHMALRAPDPEELLPGTQAQEVTQTREAMLALAERLYRGQAPEKKLNPITDLIHLGIGGSDLGPRLVAEALDNGDSAVKVHWLSTLDAGRWKSLAARLNPASTALVIVSKSFSTAETLLQARAVRQWLGAHWQQHTWAVTAQADKAHAFGVARDRVFTLPHWTGGRFSLWSAVGVSAAAVVGADAFRQLLHGAWQADMAFRKRRWQDNPAVLMALIWHFLRVECAYPAFGVVSYEPRLARLSDWLQQVVMESLGKRMTTDNQRLTHASAPLIFGGTGTDLQHSLFQALHQGSDAHPVLFVGSVRGGDDSNGWQAVQLSHLLAQGTVLAQGREHTDAARVLPGNRPSMTLLIDELDPEALATLLVMFEHAVFTLGHLWHINPFDQWGVEEGKRMAGTYLEKLEKAPGDVDTQAGALLRFIHRHR